MPRSSRIESAVGVVGSFAPSTTTLQSIDRAFLSRVITPPRAHGTSQSHGISHSSSFVIARPSFHSETGCFCAACASRPGMSRPFSFTMPPFTSLTAITLAPASVSSSRARLPPTLPKPWMTTRLPLRGMPKSRAYSAITYITPRPVASSRPSEPPSDSQIGPRRSTERHRADGRAFSGMKREQIRIAAAQLFGLHDLRADLRQGGEAIETEAVTLLFDL